MSNPDSLSMRYNPPEPVLFRVDRHWRGSRIDRYVTEVLHWRSRTSIQESILDGQVTLNGRAVKPSAKVQPGDTVRIDPRPELLPPFDPESVRFETLYEDDVLLVINKPPHIVVHPTCSHLSDNLMRVMNHRYAGTEGPEGPVTPRLAHRIDANTSGALLLTKQESVRAPVARQFAKRKVHKEYHALVVGVPKAARFEVDAPIGRDPNGERTVKRAVRAGGLPSRTGFRILQAFGTHALVSCEPLTGRTHQIRVHLAHAGHPIAVDALYGEGSPLTRGDLGLPPGDGGVLLDRHALHSRVLRFRHPVDDSEIEVTAPYTEDFHTTLESLGEACRDGS